MKELYISPELEILCFMPCEGIVTEFDLKLKSGNIDDGLSYGETTKPDDYFEDVTVPGGGSGSNPDGDL